MLELCMVRKERLELSRLAALEPKSSASTNFATSAYCLTRSCYNEQITQGPRLCHSEWVHSTHQRTVEVKIFIFSSVGSFRQASGIEAIPTSEPIRALSGALTSKFPQ
jgi:hypothetical protein